MMTEMQTKRLMLRLLEFQDAEPMERLVGDKDIARMTLNIPHPYPAVAASAFIERRQAAAAKGEGFSFAILDKTNQDFLGVVGLRVDQIHNHAELAYWVGKPYWSNGYCSEAAVRVLRFAFEELKLHRVWAAAMTINPASSRVLEKLGMRHEGVFRNHVLKWNQYEDLTYYGILRSDYDDSLKRSNSL